jgi:hypothetical protein
VHLRNEGQVLAVCPLGAADLWNQHSATKVVRGCAVFLVWRRYEAPVVSRCVEEAGLGIVRHTPDTRSSIRPCRRIQRARVNVHWVMPIAARIGIETSSLILIAVKPRLVLMLWSLTRS